MRDRRIDGYVVRENDIARLWNLQTRIAHYRPLSSEDRLLIASVIGEVVADARRSLVYDRDA